MITEEATLEAILGNTRRPGGRGLGCRQDTEFCFEAHLAENDGAVWPWVSPPPVGTMVRFPGDAWSTVSRLRHTNREQRPPAQATAS